MRLTVPYNSHTVYRKVRMSLIGQLTTSENDWKTQTLLYRYTSDNKRPELLKLIWGCIKMSRKNNALADEMYDTQVLM